MTNKHMTDKQLKSMLTRYRIIFNILYRSIAALIIIAIILFICGKIAMGFILGFGCTHAIGIPFINTDRKIMPAILD